jgi:hypothetical protein
MSLNMELDRKINNMITLGKHCKPIKKVTKHYTENTYHCGYRLQSATLVPQL